MPGAPASRGTLRRARRRVPPRGFTLIEIGVVLLVVVILMMIAIPTIRNVTGMKARTEVSKLAANLRAARGHAAVSGETCRMVIDLTASSYGLECTKGQATIAKETSHNGRRDNPEDGKFAALDDTLEEKKAREALANKAKFAPAKVLPMQHLSGGLGFVSVWTPHQSDPYTQGQAYVYFFPSGSTEQANIILRWGEDEYYTIQMTGLIGQVHVIGEKASLPTQDNSDDY